MHQPKGIAYIPIVLMVVSVTAFAWMAYATWQYSQLETEVQQPAVITQRATTNASTVTNTPAANTNTVTVSTTGWKTYTNSKYQFSLQYPSKDDEISDQGTSIRIQNYSSAQTAEEEKAGLKPDEFYMEISENDGSCDAVIDGATATFGAATGTLGTNGEGGDAGGYRSKAACITNNGVTLEFLVTEGDKDDTIASGIFSTLTFDDTLGWKTYENAQYHFSFKHPANWEVEKAAIGVDAFSARAVSGDEGSLTVQPVTAQGSGFPDGLTMTKKTVTIGGKKATQSTSTYTATGKVFQSLVSFDPQPTSWGATAQILIQPDANGSIDVPNQILSTFTFDGTLGWKTYSNKDLGFQFEYPDGFGDFTLKAVKSDSGQVLVSSFAGGKSPFTLGGTTKDFSAATEGQFIWTQGYRKDGGTYWYLHGTQTKPGAETKIAVPVQTIAAENTTILLLDGVASPDTLPVADPMKGYVGALVNLPGGTFPGLGIRSDLTEMTREEFTTMLATFTVTD